MTQGPSPPGPFREWPEPRAQVVTSGGVLAVVAFVVVVAALERLLGTLRGLGAAVALAAVVGIVAGALRWSRRVRAAHAVRSGGGWEADWTGPRDGASSSFLRRKVPLAPSSAVLLMCVVFGSQAYLRWLKSPDAACAGGALVAVTLLLCWSGFRGGPQVRFDRLPYLLGERAVFWVATTSGASRLEGAEVLLRCVHFPPREPPLVLFTRHAALAPEHPPGPDEFVAADLGVLPRDVPGTSLHGSHPVRWELLVAGRSRWGDVVEAFVVPVYART